jgi:hypothetical protein
VEKRSQNTYEQVVEIKKIADPLRWKSLLPAIGFVDWVDTLHETATKNLQLPVPDSGG